MIKYLLLSISFSILYAQNSQDYDMDGVPDTIDVCSHTPFFDKVDRYGCSIKRLILPEDKDNHNIDIIFHYGLIHNDDSIDRENLYGTGVELDYYRNSWIYTIKSGYLRAKAWSDLDDTTLSIKKHFQPKQNIKLTTGMGVEIPTHKFKGNRVDFSIIEHLNYYPNDNLSLFIGGTYTFINDISSNSDIGNQYSYYFGLGYFISGSLYSNISYSTTDSKFQTQHLIHTIVTTIFYQINRKWFTSLSYGNEILDEDLHNSVNFKIGYSFSDR